MRMPFNKAILSLVFLFLTSISLKAQEVEMATGMRANGKIYVVVAVLATIFVGIIVYLIVLDRRIKRLEREKKS